jgi:hypothetical protein
VAFAPGSPGVRPINTVSKPKQFLETPSLSGPFQK